MVQSGKESAWNAGDLAFIPGLERSPGEWNGYPLQSSRLVNPMDRGAWWVTVHGVTKSRQLSDQHFHPFCIMTAQTSQGHLWGIILPPPLCCWILLRIQTSAFPLFSMWAVPRNLRTASLCLLTLPGSALSHRPSPLHPSTAPPDSSSPVGWGFCYRCQEAGSSLVVKWFKTRCSQCREPGFDPWSVNENPTGLNWRSMCCN